MRRLGNAVLDFLKDESGPTAVEYAITTGLIIAFLFPTVVNMTNNGKAFNQVSNTLKGTGS
jgi:Flp pilus assembly pilin Flp